MPENTSIRRTFSDYLGISSATVCLIHCLAAPVLMSMGISVHEHEGQAHGWGILLSHSWDFLFLGIGLIAVIFSSRHMENNIRKILLWSSFGFLTAAILFEHVGPMFQYLTYISSLALILMHSTNIMGLLQSKKR